jgi:hypothetical protein
MSHIPAKERNLIFDTIQTSSGAHLASSSIGAGVLSQEVKQLRCEVHHSPPSHSKAEYVKL